MPDDKYDGQPDWFTATVSKDLKQIGVTYPVGSDWRQVRRAYIALRDRLSEFIENQDACPLKAKRGVTD